MLPAFDSARSVFGIAVPKPWSFKSRAVKSLVERTMDPTQGVHYIIGFREVALFHLKMRDHLYPAPQPSLEAMHAPPR